MKPADPEVREFLARSMVVRLAALSPKGQPNIRCLWFVYQRGRIYLPTQETTAAGRSAAAHPDVALLFDGEMGQRASRLLRVRGRAVFRRETRIVVRAMLGIYRKYFLTRPGLQNLLAHATKVPVVLGFYAERRGDVGEGVAVLEVRPEDFEFLPRSQA